MNEVLLQQAVRLLQLIQGGPETIQSLMDEHRAEMDLARSPFSGSTVMTGAAQQLYLETATVPWFFAGGYIDFTGATFGGITYTINVNVRIVSGGALRLAHTEVVAALPAPVLIPVPRNTNTDVHPAGLYNVYGVQVTIQQSAIGGGWSTLPHEWFDAKRSV